MADASLDARSQAYYDDETQPARERSLPLQPEDILRQAGNQIVQAVLVPVWITEIPVRRQRASSAHQRAERCGAGRYACPTKKI